MKHAVRWTSKLVAVAFLASGAAYLTGCCCCGPSIPGPEFLVGVQGPSTLPDLEELHAPTAAAMPAAMGY